MNQAQINTVNMAKTTQKTWTITQVIGIRKRLSKIKGRSLTTLLRPLMEKTVTQKGKKTESYSTNKDVMEDKLIAKTLQVALRIEAYAKNKGNIVLMNDVDLSERRLKKGGEKEMIARCKNILQKAILHKTDLDPWKVKDADRDELSKLITDFEPLTAERDGVGKERELATLSIDQLVKLLRAELRHLDTYVYALVENTDFINLYKQARETFDRRGGHSVSEDEAKVA